MSLTLPRWASHPRGLWRGFARWLASRMPKGLFARSLLIVILPVVLLQSAVAYIFMERHWQLVTQRLSAALVADIAAIIDIYDRMPDRSAFDTISSVAGERFGMDVKLLPSEPLPQALPKPFFSLLDTALSQELARQVQKPFWIDTIGNSDLVEIRVALRAATLRVIAARSAAYASNSHIFLGWMMAASLVLLAVAIAFLRNQIRPILRLARATQDFGKGREVEFRPQGAREVRQAAYAFMEMRRRVERAMEQRTTMLNGVSHDLRTVLTRFKLSLAMLPPDPDIEALQGDVEEMQRMLEAYLAFARGDEGEQAEATDIRALLDGLRHDAERHGRPTGLAFAGEPLATVRPAAFRRLMANLVANAQRHGRTVAIEAQRDQRFLTIHVDDDGPGIPPEKREDVFRPFFRLDEARNQDEGGTGLGLAIARDIARAHGGDIQLAQSPLGGLRATVRVPI